MNPGPPCRSKPAPLLLLLQKPMGVFPWPPMRLLTRLAHRLHAGLDAEQRGRLDRFDVARRYGSQNDGCSCAFVGSLIDEQAVVFSKAVVERHQPAAHTLQQPAYGFAAVLW